MEIRIRWSATEGWSCSCGATACRHLDHPRARTHDGEVREIRTTAGLLIRRQNVQALGRELLAELMRRGFPATRGGPGAKRSPGTADAGQQARVAAALADIPVFTRTEAPDDFECEVVSNVMVYRRDACMGRLALHEAAHVVTAAALGLPLKGAAVFFTGQGRTALRTDEDLAAVPADKFIMFRISGRLAEELAFGSVVDGEDLADFEQAVGEARRIVGEDDVEPLLQEAVTRCVGLLAHHWSEVDSVSRLLLRHAGQWVGESPRRVPRRTGRRWFYAATSSLAGARNRARSLIDA